MASHEVRNQSGKNQHLPPRAYQSYTGSVFITYKLWETITAPEEIIRPHIEMYFSIGRSDVEIVDLLKAHYDTNVYGFGYVVDNMWLIVWYI